jgi:hypothetical protein
MNGNKFPIRTVSLYTFTFTKDEFIGSWLIGWPERVAQHLRRVASLIARIVVGWVFMCSDGSNQQVRSMREGREAFPSFERLEGESNADAIRRQP